MSGTGRGAPLKSLDDDTALNGDQVDVRVRIGWTLRMARLLAGERSVESLTEMAARLGDLGVPVSLTSLHRLESGQVRLGHLNDAYERVLGMPVGALRAPADIVCRTFSYHPADRGTDVMPSSVEEMSVLLDRVRGGQPNGGDWLTWARAVRAVGGLGVPVDLMRDLVLRLVSEMGRTAATAYHSRYEAAALLRCSAYGGLVLRAAQEVIADPHVQVVNDLMSLVGESATVEARDWAAQLLQDPRDLVSFGATLCLENMADVGGDRASTYRRTDLLLTAFAGSAPDSERWRWLSHLVRLLPPAERERTKRLVGHPLAPTGQMREWGRTRINKHWTLCEEIGRGIADDLGIPEQPLLARLLFEIAMGPHETRAVTSYMLLRGIPALGDQACAAVAQLAQTHEDAVVRERSTRRLVGLVDDSMPTVAAAWLEPDHPRLPTALRLAGNTGTPIAPDLLDAALARDDSRSGALYAAGMTDSPWLTDLLDDPGIRAEVRAAAQWWRGRGPRVSA